MKYDDEHLRAMPKDQLLDDVKKMVEELNRDIPPPHPNCRCTLSYVTEAECDTYVEYTYEKYGRYVHYEGEIPLEPGVVLLTYKADDSFPEFYARLVGLADVHGRAWRPRAADWHAGQLAFELERVKNITKTVKNTVSKE